MSHRFSFLFFLSAFFILLQNLLFAQHVLHHTHQSEKLFALNSRSDSIDVLHYSITLDITNFTTKIISGNCNIQFVAKLNSIATMDLDLLKLNVDYIKQNNSLLSFTYNDTLLKINLANVMNAGDTDSLVVYYHGVPSQDPSGWGGFYFQSGYAYNLGAALASYPHTFGRAWYPCFDNFVEKASYDFYITTPAAKKAACNGLLQSHLINTNTTETWHWKMNEPISPYLACVAIGSYSTVKFNFNGINRIVPVELEAVASDTTKTKNSFVHLQNAFDTYEKSYGPYEWEKVGYSFVPFTNGAMEHASNITFPKSFTNGSTTYEDFMAHELSHHWWGDLVTCKTEGDMWINEGMASYSENLFFENVYGYANYITKIKANQTKILHFAHHKEGGYRAISGIPELYTYGDHVYLKGKSVAHNLRSYLGDSLFFVGLKSFISTHKFTSVTSYDFRDALESATGYDLHPFFNDWVFSAGYPHFSIDSTVITNVASQNLTTVYIKQKLTGAPNYYTQVPLEITFMDSLWNKQTASIYMSGKNASFTFTLPFKPKYAALNLNQKINDAISSEAQTIKAIGAHNFPNALMNVTVKSISDSVFLRVEHNWTSPDALKDSSKNYILSPNRYWKIDGLINSDFKATAKITYDGRTSSFSGTSYLDNELITATEDSLVLLYRSNASADWNLFPYYTKAMGNVNDKTGTITIDSLFLGEYTLAMKTAAPTTIKVIYESSKGFRIYPNPAGDKLNIEFNGSNYNNSDININDSNLKLINSFHLEGNESVFSTSTRDWPNGIYFVVVTQRTTQQTIMQKVIIRHGR